MNLFTEACNFVKNDLLLRDSPTTLLGKHAYSFTKVEIFYKCFATILISLLLIFEIYRIDGSSDIDTQLFATYKMKLVSLINDLINDLGYLNVHY